MFLLNEAFGTRPIVVHAQGPHAIKPHWPGIRAAFFASDRREYGPAPGLTVLTCNNGHEAMGLLERSLDHLGVPYVVTGQGMSPWVNSTCKPLALSEALAQIETPYVLYADSRDAIVIGNPATALLTFLESFSCDLLFGADRLNWPPLREFKQFEQSISAHEKGDFRYLNGGGWIGRTSFCREFFDAARQTAPVPEVADSEQGILRQLFPRYYPRVQIDYRCQVFQNIGFVFGPGLTVVDAPEPCLAKD